MKLSERMEGMDVEGVEQWMIDDIKIYSKDLEQENERLKAENAELKMQLGSNIAYHPGVDDCPSISRSIK